MEVELMVLSSIYCSVDLCERGGMIENGHRRQHRPNGGGRASSGAVACNLIVCANGIFR